MSSRYCSDKAMSSSSFGFCETPMPSVSFCLPTPFDCLYLFTYRSRPVQTNKKIDDFFFACGCRAGILFDFQMIIERGPEIFTGEPGEIIVDSLQSPVMLTVKKHIQYFYHQTNIKNSHHFIYNHIITQSQIIKQHPHQRFITCNHWTKSTKLTSNFNSNTFNGKFII